MLVFVVIAVVCLVWGPLLLDHIVTCVTLVFSLMIIWLTLVVIGVIAVEGDTVMMSEQMWVKVILGAGCGSALLLTYKAYHASATLKLCILGFTGGLVLAQLIYVCLLNTFVHYFPWVYLVFIYGAACAGAKAAVVYHRQIICQLLCFIGAFLFVRGLCLVFFGGYISEFSDL